MRRMAALATMELFSSRVEHETRVTQLSPLM